MVNLTHPKIICICGTCIFAVDHDRSIEFTLFRHISLNDIIESTQNINGKFQHMEEGSPSFVNFVMLTNRNICREHNDRRPLYLAMSQRFKGNYEHFNAIGTSLKDRQFVRYLFNYFATHDITQFHLEKDRPITQLHRSMEARATPIEVTILH
jgi:hypothetical protein